MIAIRDGLDAQLKRHPEELPLDEQAAALVITQAGYELFSRERWLPVLSEAIASGSALTLARAGSDTA